MLQRAVLGAMVIIGLQGLVQTPWQLLVLRALQGVLSGTVGPATALAAASTPRRHMGHAMGVIQTGTFMSQLVGPLAGGVLATLLGFRRSFIGTACLYAAGALLAHFFVEEIRVDAAPAQAPSQRRGPVRTLLANLQDVARQRMLLLVIGILFLLGLSSMLLRPVLALVVEDVSGVEDAPLHAGLVLAAYALTSAIAALMVGRATQRLGYRRWLIFTAAAAGTLYLPLTMAGSLLSLALLMAAVGLFSGAMLPTTNALIGSLSPEGRQGSAFGLAGSAQALTMAAGPLLRGAVAAGFGIHSGFIAAAAALYGAALMAMLFLRDPRIVGAREPAEAQPASTAG